VAVLVLAVTFVAGAVVGIFADHLLHRGHIPEFATHVLVRRLDRHLDLTDAQEKKVAAIIDRHHAQINAFFSTMQPRVRQEIEQANREIEAVLTPAQRRAFARFKMRVHGPLARQTPPAR